MTYCNVFNYNIIVIHIVVLANCIPLNTTKHYSGGKNMLYIKSYFNFEPNLIEFLIIISLESLKKILLFNEV